MNRENFHRYRKKKRRRSYDDLTTTGKLAALLVALMTLTLIAATVPRYFIAALEALERINQMIGG